MSFSVEKAKRFFFWYIAAVVIAVLGIDLYFSMMGSPEHLRSDSDYLEARSEPPVPHWSIFSNEALPASFMYPARWELEVQASEGGTTAIAGEVTVSYILDSVSSPLEVAASALGENSQNLMNWEGQIGNTSGIFFARRGQYAGTEAPFGPRVFVAEGPDSTLIISLPHPPYTIGEERVLETFQLQ